jgi:hypothetical protein
MRKNWGAFLRRWKPGIGRRLRYDRMKAGEGAVGGPCSGRFRLLIENSIEKGMMFEILVENQPGR